MVSEQSNIRLQGNISKDALVVVAKLENRAIVRLDHLLVVLVDRGPLDKVEVVAEYVAVEDLGYFDSHLHYLNQVA